MSAHTTAPAGASTGGTTSTAAPATRTPASQAQTSWTRSAPTPVRVDRTRMSQTLFRPHDPRGTVRMMRVPKAPLVAFTPRALQQIGAYVGLMDKEIGWMSSVERREPGLYVVDECFLFGQAVHGATTEIDPEKLGELIHEILQTRPADGVDLVNSLKCWGHSHVNMGVSPSGQDDRQMDDFAETVADYMIRVIANKKGEIRVCVWDYAAGLIFEDTPWTALDAHDPERLNAVADEIEAKVTNLGYGSTSWAAGGTRATYSSAPAAAEQDDQADFGFNDDGFGFDNPVADTLQHTFEAEFTALDAQDSAAVVSFAIEWSMTVEEVYQLLLARDEADEAAAAVGNTTTDSQDAA